MRCCVVSHTVSRLSLRVPIGGQLASFDESHLSVTTSYHPRLSNACDRCVLGPRKQVGVSKRARVVSDTARTTSARSACRRRTQTPHRSAPRARTSLINSKRGPHRHGFTIGLDDPHSSRRSRCQVRSPTAPGRQAQCSRTAKTSPQVPSRIEAQRRTRPARSHRRIVSARPARKGDRRRQRVRAERFGRHQFSVRIGHVAVQPSPHQVVLG
jgi:hypothetical protein